MSFSRTLLNLPCFQAFRNFPGLRLSRPYFHLQYMIAQKCSQAGILCWKEEGEDLPFSCHVYTYVCMSMCMHVCMCACIIFTCLYTCINVHMCICIRIYVHTCVHVCVHNVYASICIMDIRTYNYTYVCMCVCMYVHMCMCI